MDGILTLCLVIRRNREKATIIKIARRSTQTQPTIKMLKKSQSDLTGKPDLIIFFILFCNET
jgi:hypothetical protein